MMMKGSYDNALLLNGLALFSRELAAMLCMEGLAVNLYP